MIFVELSTQKQITYPDLAEQGTIGQELKCIREQKELHDNQVFLGHQGLLVQWQRQADVKREKRTQIIRASHDLFTLKERKITIEIIMKKKPVEQKEYLYKELIQNLSALSNGYYLENQQRHSMRQEQCGKKMDLQADMSKISRVKASEMKFKKLVFLSLSVYLQKCD
ncbi:MAG: hypothetical protein EZS28_010531 [Streblomastix strix]|uniref:Uncharacterized protein n=1 Tax=Streblomastix strix TaxID=222440 RepID=A0A5J4WGB6_9EUKA|nr:MAG: hypothetical protein EZS28_010531 [Streblomastix strix]